MAAFAFALLVRVLGLEPTAFRLGIRPVTNLIDTPNFYSLVVAVLAGIVGIVSLTHARTSTLLGVFISVTTIPAASDIGVASAFGSWSEARGSLLQLLLNVVVLILVGLLTLRFVRLLWRRIRDSPQPGRQVTCGHRIAMGLTGEPVADGSRSGAITHRNDQRSASTQRGTSSSNRR